jgi:succinate dehydrogenase/fumarate reductase flavoprotein subunit
MTADHIEIAGLANIPLYTVANLIIGSGAAGLNCAEHLHELGQECAIVTDCLGAGTSNNAGSDKQTYYKLGVFGDVPDSPMEFARSLFNGGMCHGDLAYVEALGSLPEFFHLVRNGVEFPCNRYGAYVGYKTDHDPRQRATSAGPKTSMQMVQRSLTRLRQMGTDIFDGYEVVRLLTVGVGEEKRVVGALALNLHRLSAPEMGLTVFLAENVILATGGPGEMYELSVYPHGQIGNHGLALEIGAQANNLSESQFGLASIGFRWNLSGTYQQVIPSYFSEDEAGQRHDFLREYYRQPEEIAGAIFLKGYQWPFHAGRLQDFGSSLVDLAVHEEREQGRRVYMDFSQNVAWKKQRGAGVPPALHLGNLPPEARAYLERSGATQETPFDRLLHMNPLAIDLYHEHGVDLREPLEVAVCAQHCNGGLTVDLWWQTTVPHLFAIGEVAGTHGVRPGGSALNAGQVGGLRAAQYIAARVATALDMQELLTVTRDQIAEEISLLKGHLTAPPRAPRAGEVRTEIQQRMTQDAAFVRSPERVREALSDARKLLKRIKGGMRIMGPEQLPEAVQNHHLCLTHVAFLTAIDDLLSRGGGSRGAYMVLDREGNLVVETAPGPRLPHRAENLEMRQEIIEVRLNAHGEFDAWPTAVRPLPEDDSWYENTWREWREERSEW